MSRVLLVGEWWTIEVIGGWAAADEDAWFIKRAHARRTSERLKERGPMVIRLATARARTHMRTIAHQGNPSSGLNLDSRKCDLAPDQG